MDRLWSPWRYQYVSQTSGSTGCIFCQKSAEQKDEENLLIARASHNFVLLNLFPYSNGHLMIAPYAHVATLEDCPREALYEMIELAQKAEAVLRRLYRAAGMNLGLNIGECAGAGVAGHLHLHVVPRWPGDANFMTTLGETRVLPEDLATTWQRLREVW
jgi:ATP adenylyltransferase